MYAVLSYIPTAVLPSKPNFTRYVKANIFELLGLNSTTYSFDVANATGNLADGFFKQQTNSSASPFDVGIPRAIPFWAQVGGEDGHFDSGAGGVISNAVDMASWLQALLSGGQNPVTKEVILPPDAINMVSSGITVFESSPQVLFHQHPFLSASVYGAGQVQSTYRGHVVVEHGGSVPGFNSYISRFPFDGVGISVLSNENELGSAISLAIKYRLSDQALGLTPIDSKTIVGNDLLAMFSALLPPIPRPENATLPPNGVETLAGLYEDPAYGRMELCLASANSSAFTSSDGCRALLSNITTVLPGVVDPTIPTLLVKWDRPFGAYIRLTHLNESTFSLSIFDSYPTGNSSSPFWASPVVVSGPLAEFAQDNGTLGFGLFAFIPAMQPSQLVGLEERKIVPLSNGSHLEMELQCSRNPASLKLVICLHPWSWLGGRMDDPVLHSLSGVLEKHEYHILRYNSRGVGASKGWPSLTGHTEGRDLEALVQWALQTIPELRSIVLLGYSHGSLIASLHPLLPPPVEISHILLSYPLGARMFLTLFNSGTYASKLKELVDNPASNVLIIFGDQDEFTGVSNYDEWAKSLSSETRTGALKVVKVEGGSHFWRGRANNTMQNEIDHWLDAI
ncbi:hypothetical protein EYR40_007809 [Pleurotus pulmonarius]|nr:hypothetical protein EYR40_007809 [Pleurotus pulmonarius]